MRFIQLEHTSRIQRGKHSVVLRPAIRRGTDADNAMRKSEQSLKQRWQSFVVIRIISLDARYPNAHLRCRVCLFTWRIFRCRLSQSDGPPLVPTIVTLHVQRRPEIINETSEMLPTLCAYLIIPRCTRLSAGASNSYAECACRVVWKLHRYRY